MNCPTCQSVMSCKNQIHKNKYGDIMDLHCWNDNCLAKQNKFFLPYIKVLAPPEQKWICLEYGFPFHKNNKYYVLSGSAYIATVLSEYFKITDERFVSQDIFQINYTELSTDNDMDIQATKLFNRMYNLIQFS